MFPMARVGYIAEVVPRMVLEIIQIARIQTTGRLYSEASCSMNETSQERFRLNTRCEVNHSSTSEQLAIPHVVAATNGNSSTCMTQQHHMEHHDENDTCSETGCVIFPYTNK